MPDFNGQRLYNIADPVYDKDGVSLRFLNNKLTNFSGNSFVFSGGTVSGDTIFLHNLSATRYYSGATLLETIINNIAASYSGVTGDFLPLSGGTVSGNTNFNNGAILQSGGTDLYNIFLTTDIDVVTTVQPGRNISTGGTPNSPIINLANSPSINGLTFSGTAIGGNLSVTNLSGGTIYSGNTDIDSLFANKIHAHSQYATLSGANFSGSIQSGGTDLYNIFLTGDVDVEINIQPGLNTYTGGTSLNPTVNISAATLSYLSATTLSGGTIYSGNTDLSSLFTTQTSLSNYTTNSVFTVYTASTNTTLTGLQNQLNTKANLSGATFTGNINTPSLSATTLSGGTIYSGNTNLYNIFSQLGGQVTSALPGTNVSTGGTATNPIINLINSPSINGLTFSGTATGNILSANTLSAATFYSGSTSLKSAILNNTGVSATTYGSTTTIPIITIQADGRISSASTATITTTPPVGSNLYLFYNY